MAIGKHQSAVNDVIEAPSGLLQGMNNSRLARTWPEAGVTAEMKHCDSGSYAKFNKKMKKEFGKISRSLKKYKGETGDSLAKAERDFRRNLMGKVKPVEQVSQVN